MARHQAWLAGTVTVVLTLAILGWQLTSSATPPKTSTGGAKANGRSARSANAGGPVRTAGNAPGSTPAGGDAITWASSAVGALFPMNNGQLGSHFCTASVIDSPARDLLITAAHCVSGYQVSAPANLAFVPGYDGTAPLGIWKVTRIFVDAAWTASADPNDDVAFLKVAPSASGTRIQDVTGAEDLGIGLPAAGVVRVVGYPDTASQPIICEKSIRPFGPSQIEFDCDNFAMGTSGSPLLSSASPLTGTVSVIGVIGGYQQGGISADISYAAILGQNTRVLYQTAAAAR